MTEQEKLQRKQLWNSMSPDKQKQMIDEYQKIREWEQEQRKRREEELRDKGEWQEFGLDVNQEKLADIIAEGKRRLIDLQKKYGL